MKYLMIVSEDESIVESLRIILKDYIVEKVLPIEMIEKIRERSPFLVFLDTYLNKMDPCELIDKIHQENEKILIVPLISSYDKNTRKILEKNIFEIIEKPYLIEKIFFILKKAEGWTELNLEKEMNKTGHVKEVEKFENEKIEKSDILFQMLFHCVTENFLNTEKVCDEIVKILRRYFFFNYISIFLRDDDFFKPYSSIGIDEKIYNEIKLTSDDPVIKFIKDGKIFDLRKEVINIDLKNFASILKCSLVFPLKTFKGKLIGFLTIGEKCINEEITKEEILLLNILSDYLAIVFDNFFLYNEINYQEKYQEFVFQNLPAGIIGVDKEGRINLLNKEGEKILKVSFSELKGKKIEKVGSQIADFLRRSLLFGEVISRVEFEFIPTKEILGMSTNVIRDNNDNIIGVVGIFQNLTNIKEIEKKEKDFERNRFWRVISSRLSHELKNPLVAINTFAQMLPSMYDDKEFREKFSVVVVNEIKKINEIVDWINKIGDSVELKKEVLSLSDFIENFINETKIEKKNHLYITEKIEGDILKLKEAFNYIMDFIKEDVGNSGKIVIESNKKNKNAVIILCENGKNIFFEKEDEIFMPFNTKLKTSLSIKILLAKKIIEAHQGTLNVEFKSDCKDFIITLPLKNE